jgi:hypothetical protein
VFSGRACRVPSRLAIHVFSVTYRLATTLLISFVSLECTEIFVTTQQEKNNMFGKRADTGHANHKPTACRHLLVLSVALVFVTTIYPHKASAQIVGELQANIPFQFQAGNAKLPAGAYRIRMVEDSDLTLMEISTLDGSRSALFQVQESEANSTPNKSELIFNKYGDQYFLSELFDEGDSSGSKVMESGYEKKISQGAEAAQEHVPMHRSTQKGN